MMYDSGEDIVSFSLSSNASSSFSLHGIYVEQCDIYLWRRQGRLLRAFKSQPRRHRKLTGKFATPIQNPPEAQPSHHARPEPVQEGKLCSEPYCKYREPRDMNNLFPSRAYLFHFNSRALRRCDDATMRHRDATFSICASIVLQRVDAF
jgi:hypothetical protein